MHTSPAGFQLPGNMMQPPGYFGTSGPHLMSQSMNGLSLGANGSQPQTPVHNPQQSPPAQGLGQQQQYRTAQQQFEQHQQQQRHAFYVHQQQQVEEKFYIFS